MSCAAMVLSYLSGGTQTMPRHGVAPAEALAYLIFRRQFYLWQLTPYESTVWS